MHILHTPWVPVYDGTTSARVTLAEAMQRPLHQIQSGRPDFDFSLILMAIGLRQTGYQPPPLLGNGTRFMQRRPVNRASQRPIGTLLLDEPGANAAKTNTDLFQRHGQRDRMCCNCAAIALYTHTQFAGAAGAGIFPGNLFHSALYLKHGGTLAGTVECNQVETAPVEAFFRANMDFWLDDPDETGECAICHEHGPLITSYWRGSGAYNYAPNPHQARGSAGQRYVIDQHHTALDVMYGAAPDGKHAIQPEGLHENAQLGDLVIGFGTCYDSATLRRMFSHQFRLRPAHGRDLIQQAVRSVWRVTYPESIPVDPASSFGGEVAGRIADMVLSGSSELTASLTVFDGYCPEPRRGSSKYGLWRAWRGYIENHGEV